jgi:hypothetical protein
MTTMLGNAHMVRRGFLARFWPVEALEVPYLNRHDMPELDAGLMDRWAEAVAAVWDRSRVPFVLELGEARGPMRAFEHQRIRPAQDAAQSEHPLYAAWLSKAAMTSVRVAAVLQLAEDAGATGVGPGAGTAAAGYAAAVMGHAEHLFAGSKQAAATSPRGRVLGWLNYTANTANTANTPGGGPHTEGSGGYGRIGGGVSTRQAWRRFRDQAWCRRAEDARTVLADLAQLGWLDGPHKGTGPGRPTELWLLHPRLTEHYARMMAATR